MEEIQIISNGGVTKVINAETGETIKNIVSIKIEIDLDSCRAILTFANPQIFILTNNVANTSPNIDKIEKESNE